MIVKHVRDKGDVYHIVIPSKKTKYSREFLITCGGIEGLNVVEIIYIYVCLRPLETDHFFLHTGKGNVSDKP